MKSTHSIPHTIEDASKHIGHTIVQTMSKDPLMQRVGIVTCIAPFDYGSKDEVAYEIYWQPSQSMPLGRPYPSLHLVDKLGEHYFIEC